MAKPVAKVIAVANQKGGVGKTTTSVNLAQGLVINNQKTLLVDGDPQGNTSHHLGLTLESIQASVADLIRDRNFPIESVIYQGEGLDIIPATPLLSHVEREMVGQTNSELRLSRRLKEVAHQYSVIIIDTPPTFGPLMNSALNAADYFIVPIDSAFFALMGIKELLAEVEEIKHGTNPDLKVLGYLLTMMDSTNIAAQARETLINNFGEAVFETSIRRSVKLKEAPTLCKTIFHHAPDSIGALDYLKLAQEVIKRLSLSNSLEQPSLRVANGGLHE